MNPQEKRRSFWFERARDGLCASATSPALFIHDHVIDDGGGGFRKPVKSLSLKLIPVMDISLNDEW